MTFASSIFNCNNCNCNAGVRQYSRKTPISSVFHTLSWKCFNEAWNIFSAPLFGSFRKKCRKTPISSRILRFPHPCLP